jgi:hypothetical protein
MRIAIIDSGIHSDHPHVGRISGGVAIASDDYLDRIGHGTAVAAAIREKCPDAELYAVKVFDRRLSANIDVIIRALEWCAANEMDLVNLSLGTANPAHRAAFELALSNGLLVVSAAELLPGSLAGVIGVAPDPDCPRDAYRYRDGMFHASPYPRSIPGVPPEHNLQGASFAVANMTGLVARALAHTPRAAIRVELIARAACNP